MSSSDSFASFEDFITHIQALREQRRKMKATLRGNVTRRSPASSKKATILQKTGGRCHICGGEIDGDWQADHVLAHALGGEHDLNNYLPAHPICNNYRWFYGTEEFQWILKLGVWLRTQIENETPLGKTAAESFCTHERGRVRRRTKTSKKSGRTRARQR